MAKQAYPVWWLWKQLPERHRRVIHFWFQTEAAAASAPSIPWTPVSVANWWSTTEVTCNSWRWCWEGPLPGKNFTEL